tara:strand:+ start:3277 stop:4827 length:1551 start_codon:yes stop_codon:yes gene_type:complete
MKQFRLNIIFIFLGSSLFGFSQNIEEIFGNSGVIYFSFDFDSKNKLNQLSKFISIDHKTNPQKAYAYANKSEFENFLKFGIDYELEDETINLKSSNHNRSNWDYYPTYSEYVSMMQAFADSFPSICKLHNIGDLSSGREILIVQISDSVGLKENEPSFLYTSSMHGNELTGYVLMLRLIDELLNGYGNNTQYTDLINQVDIWINPLANPDGAYFGGDNNIQDAIRYNSNFIDLNRNFPDPFDGDHPDGNEWQEETIIFMDLADSIPFNMSCNIHTGSEVFNYPWDMWENLTADDDWWQHVARAYVDTLYNYSSNYFTSFNDGITNGADWYEIHGGRQDFMNYFNYCREFTLEMSNDKIPNPSYLPDIWDANAASLVNYVEQSLFGLRGLITDSITGFPLKARVEILAHDTDSSHVYSNLPVGNYHRYLAQGNYDITFSKNGYSTKTINKDIYTNLATVLNVQLAPLSMVGLFENKKPKAIVNSYDVLGRSGLNNKNGIVIKLFDDGSAEKIIITNK